MQSTTIKHAGTPETLTRLVRKVVDAGERRRIRVKITMGVSIVVLISSVLALFAEQYYALLTLAASIAALIVWRPRKADTVKQAAGLLDFLNKLEPELAPGAVVTLDCDLRYPLGESLASKSVPSKATSARGRTITRSHYRDPWLTAEARLKDGTVLRWRHTFLGIELESSRRNARGKTKRKTKYKMRGTYDLTAVFSAKRYLRNARVAPANGPDPEVTEEDGRIRVRLRETVKAKTSQTAPPVSECDQSDVWMRLAERAYRHVRPIATTPRKAA